MKLGAFSVSLNVKNIKKSYEFYKKLGFTRFNGNINENWIVLKNGDTVIGLFEGMFDSNIMTFNPGWDSNAKELEKFDDVRIIEKALKEKGITLDSTVAEGTVGPGHFMVKDPDGNMILFDQHR